jgi:hypothetical protein
MVDDLPLGREPIHPEILPRDAVAFGVLTGYLSAYCTGIATFVFIG